MPQRDSPAPARGRFGALGTRRALSSVTGRRRLSSTAVRVWTFTTLLLALALLGYLAWVRRLPALAGPIWIPSPLLALGFFLTELKVIEVHFRRETHAFSLSEIPAVIGLFFVPPDQYLLALVAGTGAALLITSRQSAVKTAFNLANYVVVAVAAIVIFRSIGHLEGSPQPLDWAATFAATLVASAIGAIDIATAITALGRTLGLQVVAEGIEHAGQLQRLRELGCEFGQGYLFARPGPIEGLASVLGLTGARPGRAAGSADATPSAVPPARRNPTIAGA
jgi:hypothetical protein